EACIRSCLQDKIIAQCACYDPAYAIPPNSNPISCGKVANSDVKVDCIFNLTDNDGLTGFDVNSQCSCPQNCIQSYYKVTLSTSRWPAAAYTPPECVKNKGVAPYVFWDTSGDCRKFYEEETVLVEVYYERMNYQILAESPAYPLINLVSDTGGSVGLWLGMSVISVIEFLTMLLLLICYFLARPTDAYHPKFDEKQKKDDDLILQEYLNERERQYQLGHGDLYQKDNHMVLPPAVQSSK
uniref:Uncharacterized protein n=1 Tax=Panagrolaimus sp. JU765 TaxID=591449 RepID=A0AC34QF91_9BILA